MQRSRYRRSAWGWNRRRKAHELAASGMRYAVVTEADALVAVACMAVTTEATADGTRDRPVLYWCAAGRYGEAKLSRSDILSCGAGGEAAVQLRAAGRSGRTGPGARDVADGCGRNGRRRPRGGGDDADVVHG